MFDFFRKLFKALNSSGRSWQLSGAVILALFSGFLPSNTLLLFDVMFLALVLNVNFGLFLLFSAIFSAVGYLFDPLFEILGYTVLTHEGFESFFTAMYNSALFRWTSFNYTLVTGALIVSTLLAIPGFFLLNKVVSIYRINIGQRLNEWRLTRWMKLFNEEATSTSLFRWWGLGVFGGLFALVCVFFLLLFDPLAKSALQKTLSYALQTEVSLKGLDTDLNDLKVVLSGLQIADKEKLTHNLLEADRISFDLSFAALVEKKAVIDALEVKALAFDVKRSEMAEPYGRSKDEGQEVTSVTESSKTQLSTELFTFPEVDEILKKETLRSVSEAKKLREEITKTREKWEIRAQRLKEANELEQIESDAKHLKESLKGADLKKIASAKQQIDALKSKIEGLKHTYANLQEEFEADRKRLQKSISELKQLPQDDVARLKKKYSPNALGGSNLIGLLIDEKLGNYMKEALKYYAMLKPYLDEEAEENVKEATPPRGQGRWISYANLSTTPELLIKKAKIELKLKRDVLIMDVTDLSSNQKLYGKPMRIHTDAKGQSYKNIFADVVNDRRAEPSKTVFDIKLKGISQESIDVKALEMKDVLADATIKGSVREGSINAKSDIQVLKTQLALPSQKLVDELLQGISSFKIDIDISGDIAAPRMDVKSDLDKQLSKSLGSMVKKETKIFEEKLRSGIMNKAAGSFEGLNADIGDMGSILSAKQKKLSTLNVDVSSTSLKGLLPF